MQIENVRHTLPASASAPATAADNSSIEKLGEAAPDTKEAMRRCMLSSTPPAHKIMANEQEQTKIENKRAWLAKPPPVDATADYASKRARKTASLAHIIETEARRIGDEIKALIEDYRTKAAGARNKPLPPLINIYSDTEQVPADPFAFSPDNIDARMADAIKRYLIKENIGNGRYIEIVPVRPAEPDMMASLTFESNFSEAAMFSCIRLSGPTKSFIYA
ncbi:hypothetical protein [Bordetella sp. LUAb4]|uniref:hypothetical protein n=1 Tax=Bordetella sp. LUAb4 TaxID=2843195 RepID=UPI001E2D4C33|nr:hypothetical protein [Bordetella sp. LUAb4]